jgi:hypothetical protein
MRPLLIAAAVTGVAFSAVQVGFSQAKPAATTSIQGAWKVAEVTFTGPNARKMTSPQPSVRIFTQRHYSFNDVNGDKPRPELPAAPQPQATEKQLADAFGPFTGQAGTYEVSGHEITVRPVAAKSPNAMRAGAFNTSTFRFEGNNTLWLTSKANAAGPVANPTTLKLTRLE